MIYKRDGIYYYEFELRGRRYRESTRQRNPRIARQMESARRTQILKGEVGIREKQSTMTLRKFADDCFKPHVESTFAGKFKTREYYLNSLKNLIAFHELVDKPLDEIKPESITAYATRRLDLGMEISTVNRELMVLRRMFHLAIEWGKTDRILPKVRMIPGEKHRDRVISRDEELRYLMAAPVLLRDVATILLDCGLRPEEMLQAACGKRSGRCHSHQLRQNESRTPTDSHDATSECHYGKPDSGNSEWMDISCTYTERTYGEFQREEAASASFPGDEDYAVRAVLPAPYLPDAVGA